MADEHDATAGSPPAVGPSAPIPAGPAHAFEIMQLLRRVSVASGQFTDAMAESHELHRTDLNALSALLDAGRQGRALSAGELATRLRLSAPATTALLDRLSRVGHVHRRRNAADRRIVDIEITPHARAIGQQFFEPMGRHVNRVIARYEPHELELVERFLAEVLLAIEAARAESTAGGASAEHGEATGHRGPSAASPPGAATGPRPPRITPVDPE